MANTTTTPLVSLLCKRAHEEEDHQFTYKKTKIESCLFVPIWDQALLFRDVFSQKILKPFTNALHHTLTLRNPDQWLTYHDPVQSFIIHDILLDMVKEESIDLLANNGLGLNINKTNTYYFDVLHTTTGQRSLMATTDEHRHFAILGMDICVKLYISPKNDPDNVLIYTINPGDLFVLVYSSFDYTFYVENTTEKGFVVIFKKE